MAHDTAWARRLSAGVQPEFLVTIVVGHPHSDWQFAMHPSRLNGAICATSYHESVDTDYATFHPTLINELSVITGVDPLKRSIEEAEVDIELSADARVPIEILDMAGTMMLWGQIDYWMPGLPITKALPLVIGRVTEGRYDRRTGRTTIRLTDGDPIREVKYPPGDMTLSRANFPDIPVTVDGVFPRTVILGRWDYPLLCPQISANGYYVADHPLASLPSEVQVNGIATDVPYRIVTVEMEGPGINALEKQSVVTMIEFSSPLGIDVPFVTCSGGKGLDTALHPAILLLEEYGGYRVDRMARTMLSRLAIDTSIMVTASDNVMTIAKDRILRQSPYLGGFRRGEFVVQSLDAIPLNFDLEVGVNLFDTDDVQQSQTDIESVYNAVEITYQRNVFSQSAIDVSRQSYALDKRSAPAPLSGHLAKSEKFYGRRQLKMEFPDTISKTFETPAIVKEVALQVLKLNPFQRQRYSYPCDMALALSLPYNAVMPLTDAGRNLLARPVRFVSRTIERHKIVTTFLSEDT